MVIPVVSAAVLAMLGLRSLRTRPSTTNRPFPPSHPPKPAAQLQPHAQQLQAYDSSTRTASALLSLQGKVAVVTGGCGWLGKALCEGLAEAGCTVVITSRDASKARAAAEALGRGSVGCRHYGVELDHTSEASVERGFAAAVRAAGRVDILVNNGLDGVQPGPEGRLDLGRCTFESFTRHQVNNAGYFLLARLLRDHVVDHGRPGSIVNIGSMYGQVGSYPEVYDGTPYASPVAYHCLKGGTIHMTRHLAAYWAKDNVRVNCLSPGPFPGAGAPQLVVDRLKPKVPMARMGLPHELKGPLVLLASDAGSYMTGQNLTIDGGWTAW